MIITSDSSALASSTFTSDGYGTETFVWFPDVGSSLSIKPAVETTKFGDGYELRTSSSINTMPDKWSLTFTRASAEAKLILDFLKTHGGKTAFFWVTPHEEAKKFVCREWSATRMNGGSMAITCSFEEMFEA